MRFNDNVTISIFRELAMQLATMWVRYVRPMPFEATFNLNGVRVEIKVKELEPNTKPLRGRGARIDDIMSDRSADA